MDHYKVDDKGKTCESSLENSPIKKSALTPKSEDASTGSSRTLREEGAFVVLIKL
jgi:hypothetical protein